MRFPLNPTNVAICQVADIVGNVLVGIVQDEALDAFPPEGDGRRQVVD